MYSAALAEPFAQLGDRSGHAVHCPQMLPVPRFVSLLRARNPCSPFFLRLLPLHVRHQLYDFSELVA
ncbi:hypothetical protein RT21_19970 [Pseudomonas sp. 10B238]|nr:hypothetical protein RT21_19970 [Pseudomonas sp. 10B238]